jgi:hypothetical protein
LVDDAGRTTTATTTADAVGTTTTATGRVDPPKTRGGGGGGTVVVVALFAVRVPASPPALPRRVARRMHVRSVGPRLPRGIGQGTPAWILQVRQRAAAPPAPVPGSPVVIAACDRLIAVYGSTRRVSFTSACCPDSVIVATLYECLSIGEILSLENFIILDDNSS